MKKSSLIAIFALALVGLLVGCEATEYAAIIATSNGKLHHCYGKVVDQYGQPVVGAQAIATSVFMVSPVASRNEDHFTKTDAQGLFQFTGILGWEVGFGVKKERYEWNGQGELPDEEKSTSENRDVFVMYKLQGAEPMVHTKFDSRVPYDGTSATFDLMTEKKSDGGNFKITLLRTPLQIRRGRDHFEWSLRIEIIDGGLAESSDSYPYLAPDGGYQNAITISEAKDAPNWTQNVLKTYYIRFANGEYGRVRLDMAVDSERPDTGLNIESYLNPSGSRNLEWDEAKEIKPEVGGR